MTFDWLDLMTLCGLLLLGWSVWELAGWPGVVGYVGALAVVLSTILAYRRAS